MAEIKRVWIEKFKSKLNSDHIVPSSGQKVDCQTDIKYQNLLFEMHKKEIEKKKSLGSWNELKAAMLETTNWQAETQKHDRENHIWS